MSRKSSDVPSVEAVSWRGMLEARPRRNLAAQVQRGAAGAARVSVPLRRPWWLVAPVSWILRPSGRKRVGLDSLGAETLELCDGNRTVEQIVDEFARRHGLTFHESRVAVTGFLKALVQRGVLAIEQRQ